MRARRHLVVALGLTLSLPGCDFELSARHATLTYTDDARAAYNEAMESFRARDWESSRTLFGEIRKLFNYSRYARLAELRLADIDFELEKYSEAIAGYRDFAQNHRNDPDIEYARYRMTKALFLDIDDTFLLPPHEERDQATAMEAYKELRSFLREFPRSRYNPDTRYMLEAVTGRLMRHQLYVARFYLKQDNFEATIARIDQGIKLYPESTLVPEALVLKGETLLKMHKPDEARASFELVVKKHGGPFSVAARRFLDELDAREKHTHAAADATAASAAPAGANP